MKGRAGRYAVLLALLATTALVLLVLSLLAPGRALASGPIIVIDPGHSGTSLTTIDPETQVRDEEYCNDPEITNVFDVAIRLKEKLEAAGYTVLLTKHDAMDTVTKRERVDVANNSNAALGVSIHTSGRSFGNYGEIYVQNLTSYRENIYGQKVYFTDPAVAALSAEYGRMFEAERRKIEGDSVVVRVNTNWEARGLAPGNIPIVQLWSRVPWILNEAGVPSGATQRDLYAQSLFNSIVACVPLDAQPPTPVIPATRFEQTDERMVKKGTWETFSKSAASAGSYGRSLSAGASVAIEFAGTRLDLIGMCGTTGGIADVYLDGVFQGTIDLGAPTAAYRVTLWSTGELPNGPHTVELVRNPRSGAGRYLNLDAVDIVGALVAPQPVVTSLDPGFGNPAGGASVVISGAGFTGVTGVTFGGVPATMTSVDSAAQRITVVAPERAAGTVQVQVAAAGGKTPDTAHDDFIYQHGPLVARYEQSDGRIAKTGTWVDFSASKASGGSYGRSSTAGASATISFRGTRLDWVAMKGATTGVADVYLDGTKAATVNLAASPTYDVVVWSTGELADGVHTVRIVRSRASATGRFVTLDALDVWGTLVAAPIRYEQADTRIVRVGTWANFTNSGASGGSYGRSSTNGPPVPGSLSPASATIHFTGTRLDWVAMKGTTTGVADVYLDGDKVATVDLSAQLATYNVVVWSSGTLSAGDHTVRIERNPVSASGTFLTLDAFDVWGAD